jgi:hypothetical protein
MAGSRITNLDIAGGGGVTVWEKGGRPWGLNGKTGQAN